MAPNGSDATTQQYDPDQSQYVPPLETWPPQGPATHGYRTGAYDFQAPPPPAREPVVAQWIFVGLGLIVPLSALVVGLWALTRTHSDSRYTRIAFAGFGVFALTIWLNTRAVGVPVP
jgi:hypothetical protein